MQIILKEVRIRMPGWDQCIWGIQDNRDIFPSPMAEIVPFYLNSHILKNK